MQISLRLFLLLITLGRYGYGDAGVSPFDCLLRQLAIIILIPAIDSSHSVIKSVVDNK